MTSVSRSSAKTIFQAALHAVAGDQAVMNAVAETKFGSRVHLAAIGKAASAMALGARAALDSRIARALILTKYDHTSPELRADSRFQIHESSHPIPDAASLQAGAYLTDFVSGVDEKDELLVLLSGGASALVEQLPSTMSLHDLTRVTDFMLSSGMNITQMNRVRRSLSCIKGGGLGASLSGAINKAKALGFSVPAVSGDLHQDVTDNARMIVSQILSADAVQGVYIWAGESTVNLPANPYYAALPMVRMARLPMPVELWTGRAVPVPVAWDLILSVQLQGLIPAIGWKDVERC